MVIKNINTNAQVDKAAIKWLEENKKYAWEGDYYFDNPGELVLIFVSLEGTQSSKRWKLDSWKITIMLRVWVNSGFSIIQGGFGTVRGLPKYQAKCLSSM